MGGRGRVQGAAGRHVCVPESGKAHEKFKGMELVVEPVEKVNVTLDGIILREEGRNISPTIYINDMYKKYQDCGDLEETLMAACDFMERAYEQAPVVDVESRCV